EKNAERVRNSIERSLRAMSHAQKRMSATCHQRLAVGSCIGAGINSVRRIVSYELAVLHHGGVRGKRESLGEIVRNDDYRGPGRAQLLEEDGEGTRATFVESAVWLVGQHELGRMHHRPRDRHALLHASAEGPDWSVRSLQHRHPPQRVFDASARIADSIQTGGK